MTPVVVVGFNRPELTRRTLTAALAADPERLFVVLDGPRADRPDDVERCAQVRAVVDSLTAAWPGRVERRVSGTNLGCEANVELGLDWVFGQVREAIVLEDDCLADPTFFTYATELLDRYRDDRRVWQVAGNSHLVPPARFGDDDYRFAAWASVWGWATWADRWRRHRALFPRDHAGPDGDRPRRTRPVRIPPGTLVTRAGRRHFEEAATSDDVVRHGWDKHWWLSMMTEGGLAATPAVNLVQNTGFGEGATHGVYAHDLPPAEPMAFPLRHPEAVSLDIEVERELELLLSRLGSPVVNRIRRAVTNPALRSVGRRVLHSAAAAQLTRVVSRAADRGASRGR